MNNNISMADMLKDGSALLGTALSEYQITQLTDYFRLISERNKSVNLTRITSPEDAVTKHFLDSLTPCLTGKVTGKTVDVGTGAGFPGLVLKCALPDIDITLLDSLNKRVNFLRDAANAMHVSEGIHFVHSRAEDAGLSKKHREKYDTAVARAVANMRVLSEWCLPLVKTGGYFLALKGPTAQTELDEAARAISVLGGEIEDVFSCAIPFTDLEHKIIVIKKVKHTPPQFPRKGKKAAMIPAETVKKII